MAKTVSVAELGHGGASRAIRSAQCEPVLVSKENRPTAWIVSAKGLAELAEAQGVEPGVYARALELIAVDLYQQEVLTLGRAAKLAGLSLGAFIDLCAKLRVPVLWEPHAGLAAEVDAVAALLRRDSSDHQPFSMPALRVYADATSLIGLSRIERLDLLTLLPQPTYVTTRVWQEIASDAEKPGAAALLQARDDGMLRVVDEGDPDAFPELDAGEATVLTAASAARAMVLVDERKARARIALDPALQERIPQVIGIVGLILLAKRLANIPAVRPLLNALVRQHFWLSPAFYASILQEAGEN